MSELPVLVAAWSGAATFALLFGAALLGAAIGSLRRKSGPRPSLLGNLIGGAVVFAIPCALACIPGLIGSTLLIAVGAPAITYLFVALAGFAALVVASRKRASGMEGCNKAFGIVASLYAAILAIVSFVMIGGPAQLVSELSSLRLLQPPVAALPFAVAMARMTGARKRPASKRAAMFCGALIFLSAYLAILFFPVEGGLPATGSPWWAFPLVGAGAAIVYAMIPLALGLRRRKWRKSQLRDARRNALMLGSIGTAMGLAWAGARALISLVAG